MNFRRRQFLHLAAGAAVLPAVSRRASAQSPASQPLLVEGHAHITNRVYWEGIDPWKVQSVGQSYARARAAGVNVLIDNIAPYGYERYGFTVKQVGRLIETFYRVLDANRDGTGTQRRRCEAHSVQRKDGGDPWYRGRIRPRR